MNIKDAYESIQKEIPKSFKIDSLKIVKKVEEYRQFWKTKKVNIVLLAESHVFTSDEELKHHYDYNKYELPDGYPDGFVRFVYCLGYGENDLLKTPIENNKGTPQFWKLFTSCSDNTDFKPILKSRTPSFEDRVKNKIELLRKMQEKRTWLLDASIIGLYPKQEWLTPKMKRKILLKCWEIYTEPLLLSSKPKQIICIGKELWDILKDKLKKINIPVETIYQPQARISSEQRANDFKKCFSIQKIDRK